MAELTLELERAHDLRLKWVLDLIEEFPYLRPLVAKRLKELGATA